MAEYPISTGMVTGERGGEGFSVHVYVHFRPDKDVAAGRRADGPIDCSELCRRLQGRGQRRKIALYLKKFLYNKGYRILCRSPGGRQ